MRILFTLISIVLVFDFNFGQVASFEFPATSSLVVSTKDPNVSVSNMSLSSGTIETNITTGTYFPNEPYIEESGGWTSSSQNSAKSFQFTITANSGYTFSITNISFRGYATGAGPSAFGFAIGSSNIFAVNAPDGVLVEVNQSVSGQTGLTSATIKIQGWLNGSRASTGGGAFRLDDVIITGAVALPVSFSSFYAYNNKLSFSTASETNNDYFTIERSGDGRTFDAIGEIKGAGNSTEEKHYEFTDENPIQGINYYRIKQTDFDGQYSYSEIRSVRHTGKGNVAISPRSTDGRLDISTEMESYDVAVYSSAGQEVARFAALAGHQTVSIDALQAGVYFVKVMSGTESETVRVIKY